MLLIALVAPVQAATQYWAALGSYQQQDRAERARDEAANRLAENFSIVPADTASGFYYRVLAGPFQSRGLADAAVANARSNGFADAWLLAQADSTSSEQTLTYSQFADDNTDFDASLSNRIAELERSAYAEPGAGELVLTPRESTDSTRKPLPELVEKAPAQYQLHKLERSP